jgi:hypothetical protein
VPADELAGGDFDLELRREVAAALGLELAAAVGEEDVGAGVSPLVLDSLGI